MQEVVLTQLAWNKIGDTNFCFLISLEAVKTEKVLFGTCFTVPDSGVNDIRIAVKLSARFFEKGVKICVKMLQLGCQFL